MIFPLHDYPNLKIDSKHLRKKGDPGYKHHTSFVSKNGQFMIEFDLEKDGHDDDSMDDEEQAQEV